ncbi:MAG: hypothetical protein GY953_08630 [bacterium]|nr:hypothetical protein [bacterium]
MECRFCGKEIHLRTRLTGETTFCSPEHQRLYREEHSRLGLARLLEEVSPSSAPEPVSPEQPEEEENRQEDAGREQTGGGGGDDIPEHGGSEADPARIWCFPPLPFEAKPLFRETTRLGFGPSEYVAGRPRPAARPRGSAPEARTAESGPSAKVRPAIRLGQSTGGAAATKPGEAAKPEEAAKQEAAAMKAPAGVAVQEPPSEVPVARKSAVPARKPDRPAATRRGASKAKQRPSPPAPEEVHFGELAEGQMSRAARLRLAAVGTVLAIAGFCGVVYMSSGEAGPVEAAPVSASEQWIFDWAQGQDGDPIALFGPSQEWAGYRAETRVNRYVGVSWVFRASDQDNYYMMRLGGGRQANSMMLVRYAMVDGQRQQYEESPIPAPATEDDIVGVRLEIRGSGFRLYLEGDLSAVWSGEWHSRGGFGVVGAGQNESVASRVKVSKLTTQSGLGDELFEDGKENTNTDNAARRPERDRGEESGVGVSQT